MVPVQGFSRLGKQSMDRVSEKALTDESLRRLDAYWRAANYLSVGQIYLYDNPLLKRPLELSRRQAHAARALGYDAGPKFHLRAFEPGHQKIRSDMIYVSGPATADPRWSANTYLEGTYSEVYPRSAPMKQACANFSPSSPFRVASRVTPRPRRPGSIHEGGELGYSLSHSFGAVFDNPELIVACVVGDGEAETGSARHLMAFE
jgi:xylulose-5-phosphate/fructose-6-phosphate phosphoketolase